jgi:hypothetical protein
VPADFFAKTHVGRTAITLERGCDDCPVSPSDKPGAGDGEVFAGLPRTRPQRRSARRQSAAAGPGVAAADAPATKPPAKPAATKPAAKKPATKRAPAVQAPPKRAAAKPSASPAVKKPRAKPPVKAPAAAGAAAPLLDHPAPADMPGAPFAPPPSGGYSAPAAPEAGTAAKGHDVLSLALRAAATLAQIGVGVARTVLGRLPRP